MKKLHATCLTAVLSQTLILNLAWAEDSPSGRVLVDFDSGFDISSLKTRDISLSLVGPPSNRRLQLESGRKTDWPGITLKPEEGVWDGSRCQHLSLDLTNTGQAHFELGLRIDDPRTDAQGNNSLTVTTDQHSKNWWRWRTGIGKLAGLHLPGFART